MLLVRRMSKVIVREMLDAGESVEWICAGLLVAADGQAAEPEMDPDLGRLFHAEIVGRLPAVLAGRGMT